MKTQLTIIGTNHGKGTSRIWLEGKRLVEAGFEVGTRYHRYAHSTPSAIQLIANSKGKYRVSGKGDKPIIDISGRAVTETFAEHISKSYPKTPVVEVEYSLGGASEGEIFIKEAGCR